MPLSQDVITQEKPQPTRDISVPVTSSELEAVV